MQQQTKFKSSSLLHTLEPKHLKNLVSLPVAIVVLVGVMLFAYLGGSTSARYAKSPRTDVGSAAAANTVEVAKEVGLKEGKCDPKEFPDTTEGIVREGGINGEGTHQLEREGGPTKTATLTSSVVNLDSYIGKKVKVCGKTFNSQKVGWLLDIGYIESI